MKEGRCIGASAMAILLFAFSVGAQELTVSLHLPMPTCARFGWRLLLLK